MARVVCLGNVVRDLVFKVPSIPAVPEKLTCTDMRTQFGGIAATAAAAIVALGGDAEFWGRVGDDEVGAEAAAALRRCGVRPVLQIKSGTRSPQSAVIVDARGERMLAAFPGVLERTPDWLPVDSLAGSGAVLADIRWTEGARALFVAARARGIPSVLDADSGDSGAIHELVDLSDHVIFSERGLAEYRNGVEREKALLQVGSARDGVVGVTLGAAGSLFCFRGRLHRFDGLPVRVVDTNGAGDVFHGAYALALARAHDWLCAVRYAGAAASLKCMRPHDWVHLPRHTEVLEFMQAFNADKGVLDSGSKEGFAGEAV
jgi:sulfofructose kinase